MLRFRSVFAVVAAASPALADTWASQVISYAQGANPVPTFTTSAAALGEPTRFTGVGQFPGAVTPFNPAYLNSEVVSIGVGGSLVVKFDTPIVNDPQHPFGIDLLVFGNAGYNDPAFNGTSNGTLFGSGQGRIEVSTNGTAWELISAVVADAHHPTLGYSDLTDPYATAPGLVPSDFTKPVNPAFNPTGLTFAQIVAAYNGSGGGAGVDIAATGLASVSYVRITNPDGPGAVEIDAFSRVAAIPAPSAVFGLLTGLTLSVRRRRPSSHK